MTKGVVDDRACNRDPVPFGGDLLDRSVPIRPAAPVQRRRRLLDRASMECRLLPFGAEVPSQTSEVHEDAPPHQPAQGTAPRSLRCAIMRHLEWGCPWSS
jgi:hypothetical protein